MTAPRLPRLDVVARRRPVHLVSPDAVVLDLADPGPASRTATPHPAPYAAVVADLADPAEGPDAEPVRLELGLGDLRLSGCYDAGACSLVVEGPTGRSEHRSRRSGTADPATVRAVGLTLTGDQVSVLTLSGRTWTVRGRARLTGRDAAAGAADPHDEQRLARATTGHDGPVRRLRAGGFGQLGLRDLRVVSHADGTAYRPGGPDGPVWLTATSAGPGFFGTAHTSVWRLDPADHRLRHGADLFFRRPGRAGGVGVYGDHATHLVRDGDRWLVATSTWGDFDERDPGVGVALAETSADLLAGRHVLDVRPLPLPTDGLRSVGTWDPHLVRGPDGWLVGYVSARRFFDFHPVVACGPDLDHLSLRAAATDRTATEGTTLMRLDGAWWVLASDGSDSPRRLRRRYPVMDLDLVEVGTLDADYPTNLPWPTLVRLGDRWLQVTFDGTAYGGRVAGYGTHGRVVLAESAPS